MLWSALLTLTCQGDGKCRACSWHPVLRVGTSPILLNSGRAWALLGRRLVDTRGLRSQTFTWSEVDNSQRTRTLGALDPGFLERDERMGFLEQGTSLAPSPEAEGWPLLKSWAWVYCAEDHGQAQSMCAG